MEQESDCKSSANGKDLPKCYVKKINDDYVIVSGEGKPVLTPRGSYVMTGDKRLAENVAEELNKDAEAFEDIATYSTYLYSFCDIRQHIIYMLENMQEEMLGYATYENLRNDLYIDFLPEYFDDTVTEEGFNANVVEWYKSLSFEQLAIVAILCSYDDSFMLPYYIIKYRDEHEGDYMQIASELATRFVPFLNSIDVHLNTNPVQMFYTFLDCFGIADGGDDE